MKIGYACKNSIYGSGNRKMTIKKLSSYSREEQFKILKEYTLSNLDTISDILLWNVKNDIYMFRISHNCYPAISHDDFRQWWKPLNDIEIRNKTESLTTKL